MKVVIYFGVEMGCGKRGSMIVARCGIFDARQVYSGFG